MNKIKKNLDQIVIALAIIASILVIYGSIIYVSIQRYESYEKIFYNVLNNGIIVDTINRNHLPDNKQCFWVSNDLYCNNLIFKRIK